jgi:hypothetical protein
MRDQVQAYQRALARLTVPLCLAEMDQKLRMALELMVQADTLAIDGIDSENWAAVVRGAGLLQAAKARWPTREDSLHAFSGCLVTGG